MKLKSFQVLMDALYVLKVGLSFFRYKVIEVLAGGGSALVEWRLETGRTHQVGVQFDSFVHSINTVRNIQDL